jgi:tRNA (Thr-GGU) A37 N-methylase
MSYELKPIGIVESSLKDLESAPGQGGTPILDVKPILAEDVGLR